VGQTSKQH